MLSRRFVYAFSFVAILVGTAACTDSPIAPTDDPVRVGTPCSQPAPEVGMVCRGDVWAW